MKLLILFLIFLISQTFEITNSLTINCFYGTKTIKVLGSVYSCHTSKISTSSGIEVTNVIGTHLSGKNNNDVTAVFIESNYTLPFVPRNFSKFFPNIKAFSINYAAIETLFGDEINEFSQLEYIDFWQIKLKTISSKLFEKTPKIIFVYFGGSLIERVGYDLFTPLNVTQLQYVSFDHNRCINRWIDDGNTTAIISLINELREKCPFDDEFFE
ncbi:hypothetical protein PVAND_010606 [Polypedilum vanderplanki]|uniref:Uncharacterized protein n=1 Tax=Polypedilum vanderplanki TaxID=319348 RepID=A0A9J6CG45_POLVA|nr:hypothetical protein PVAND_010606 [Polypedilum vanderplanki]